MKYWFLVRGENRTTKGKNSRSRVENQQTPPTHSVESGIEPSPHRWKASALFSLELTKLLFYRSLGLTSPAQHPLSCSLRHLTITASTEELQMVSCWPLCSWENGWSCSAMRSTCRIWIIMVRKHAATANRLLGEMFKLASVTRHTIVNLATTVRPGYQMWSLCDDTGLNAFFCKVRRFELFIYLFIPIIAKNQKISQKGICFLLKNKACFRE